MSLETATYLTSLNASNPSSDDLAKDGDDHIRLVKSVLKATFPTLTGAVTPTLAELNKLAGMTSSAAELNKLTGVTITPVEINRLAGVSGDIQTQLNGLNGMITSGLAAAIASWDAALSATNLAVAGKQANLGFTPVTQGGGAGMLTNTVKVGWSGSDVLVEVGATPQGKMVLGATSRVNTEVSQIAYDAVGTHALMRAYDLSGFIPGAIVDGYSLRWSSIATTPIGNSSSVGVQFPAYSVLPQGNWMCLSYVLGGPGSDGQGHLGFWKRIS